ncbi:hypothetical protein HYALB_00008162 [Hymenoscyphus albidus]|uniref:Uncharacterized protein n=1 Tax=Hymenoscyphus albidus TaxID=595503 RepID=A0A9N9M3U0_9HELO|nr:hypothetical protein HYALB_00008162 [Hymenoscyphus albidus]
MFHTARNNCLSDINARVTIPDDSETADPYYTLIKSSLIKVARKAQSESLKQLFKLVKVIVGHFTGAFGEAFWETTSREQRCSIFGACFDSHPIWVMKYYRPKEFAAVDFGAIWAKETPDRHRWRRFYRNQFIDMADSTYTHRITTPNDEGLLAVTHLWKDWPRQQKVLAWQMGNDSYELPGLVGGPDHRYEEEQAMHDERLHMNCPGAGAGNFRTPSH